VVYRKKNMSTRSARWG